MPTEKKYTYLALGDSYTIGEGVSLYESFPAQVVQLLRKTGHHFMAPEIIAKTGWTTDDLKKGIRRNVFLSSYDVVSLLVGVNNQFQGHNINEYALQLEQLVKQAIAFAGNNNNHVFILPIPDWGQSPYAAGRDRTLITQEISKYNLINKNIADEYKVGYIDIAAPLEGKAMDESLFTEDGLHPSPKEYSRWAQLLSDEIQTLIVYDK